MKIAVITGASSGLGSEFAVAVDRTRTDIDEIWLIARRREKLEELAKKLTKKARVLSLDITSDDDLETLEKTISEETPEITLLINNAGFGRLGEFKDLTAEDSRAMLRLNCEAVTVLTRLCLPFMPENSEIINICSIASFAPNARMAVYSSTKAYILSFSRALRLELKSQKINVLAVCPGPMDTEFLPVAGIAKGTSFTFDTLPRVNPKTMAEKSLKASKKGRGVYTNRLFYKFYRLLAKILPHSIVMRLCQT